MHAGQCAVCQQNICRHRGCLCQISGTLVHYTAACNDLCQECDAVRAGSNAVNVYLGLGIPWLIAAAYYRAQDEPYTVSSQGLAFALILYLAAAAVALTLLFLQRRFGGGELGGAGRTQRYSFAAAMVGMWLVYIVLASYDADEAHFLD